MDTKAKKLTDERLDMLLSGLHGAFDKWTDRIGPANKNKSIHQAITDVAVAIREHSANTGKWLAAIALAASTPNDNSAEVQKLIDGLTQEVNQSSDKVDEAIKQQQTKET